MEAKDTVMSDEEVEQFVLKLYNSPYLLVQMVEVIKKISFKAGMEYGNKKAYEIGVSDGKVEGIAEGIREVVEWVLIQDEGQMARAELGWLISPDDWQAKLKEWGVE